MILGYSELIREIYGVTPGSLQAHIGTLLEAKPNETRIAMLKILATREKATTSELLRAQRQPHTGGSFIAARRFLDRLVTLRILEKERLGRRTYYRFAQNSDLRAWLG